MRVFNFAAARPRCRSKSWNRPSRDDRLARQRHVGDGSSAIAARRSSPSPQEAEADLRELLAIPANYKVLFLQGGATGSSRPSR